MCLLSTKNVSQTQSATIEKKRLLLFLFIESLSIHILHWFH